jgi:hypothetical protein
MPAMRWLVEIILDVICLCVRLCRRGGASGLVAEVLLLRQQLLVLTRGKTKCPALSTTDRILMALCTLVMTPKRIGTSAIAVAESTLLNFHHALVARKYTRLLSSRTRSRPGPMVPTRDLIKLVVEMKEKNPGYGCPKIAMLITNVTGQAIDDETVRSILKRHYRPIPGNGPSWLLPIGNSPNKLWSVDLFRVESVFLKSYWVMLVMDQFTRRIVGFAVHRGSPDGGAVCYLFNRIASGIDWPKYLSSDYDPLFKYWLWKVNLDEHYHIRELKSVPNVPWSHPFVERQIESCRREFTDRILFWNAGDLEAKLRLYQEYFNGYRVHYSHAGKTPDEIKGKRNLATIKLNAFKWKSVCGGLFQTPIPA